MKSMFSAITSLSTPLLSKSPRNVFHEGSTPEEEKPFSASYPMWATCLNDPCVGPEIIDLSILPPLVTFFFFPSEDLAFATFKLDWNFVVEGKGLYGHSVPDLFEFTFLKNTLASVSSAKTKPIIHS